jgi:hypothetical protein
LPKLVVILGGFIIVAGIILLGMAALAVIEQLDVCMLLENKYLITLATLLIVVGLLDAFSAIIIARW